MGLHMLKALADRAEKKKRKEAHHWGLEGERGVCRKKGQIS